MDEFLTAFGAARTLGMEQIVLSFILSYVLCSVLAAVYRATFQGLSYSRTYVHTLILAGVVVTMVMMAIGNNLARGLGILGTLAIIRFRTPIRDSRDMAFLFASLGIGIGCGAGTYLVVTIGTFFICAVALILQWSPFASRRDYEGLLRFSLPGEAAVEQQVKELLEECCSAFQLVAMREAAQGDLVEYSYQIRLSDPSYQSDLVDRLSKVAGVEDATLIMQRSTVEL